MRIRKKRVGGLQKATPEATPAAQPQVTPLGREESRASDFASFYANDLRIQTSIWDVRMMFGEIDGDSAQPGQQLKIKMLGEVRMSPQLAKRFAVLLISQLQGYEAKHGRIPEPE